MATGFTDSLSPLALAAQSENSTTVHWASSRNSRGTSDVLWSCLSALIACLWTVQHPSVLPEMSWKRKMSEQIKWMIFAALIPEFVAYMAVVEFLDARTYTAKMKSQGRTWWTLTHSFYTQMGGFAIEDDPPKQLSCAGLDIVLESHPQYLPTLSEAAIKDMAKVDHLSKAFACLQSGWLVVNVVARAAQKLPISELEIATVAYIVFLFATYAFWWKKPQAVCTTTCLTKSENRSWNYWQFDMDENRLALSFSEIVLRTWDRSGHGVRPLLMPLFPIVFGALHLIAWNAFFPSSAERILWITCSLATTVSPPFLLIMTFMSLLSKSLRGLFSDSPPPTLYNGLNLWSGIPVLFYILCRLCIITEMFISLREQPIGLYDTVDWTEYIPHI